MAVRTVLNETGYGDRVDQFQRAGIHLFVKTGSVENYSVSLRLGKTQPGRIK